MTEEERKLLTLMERLISSLDGLQTNSALRQLWLETQWLKGNLQNGLLLLPTSWQLLIFKPPPELQRHPDAASEAKKLADELNQYISRRRSPPP